MTESPAGGRAPRPVVLTVFGTRPEAIKLAPVIARLRESPILSCRICVTAQHRHMLDQILGVFGLEPDLDLDLMTPSQSLSRLTARGVEGMARVLEAERPAMVLVQGDTTTAMVAALAAFYARIPVGHVEAGLRTYDTSAPYPEEANRQIVRVLTDHHFPPTEGAASHLLAEHVPGERIVVTGNTGVDAVLQAVERLEAAGPQDWARLGFPFLGGSGRMVLITGHRRESFGPAFREICRAFRDLATQYADVHFIYPVHLNPSVQSPVEEILQTPPLPNFHLTAPQEYPTFVALMSRASLIITDSGGIQEEAPSLGRPVLVTRAVTERPEGVAAGLLRIVGTDRRAIYENASAILDGRTTMPTTVVNPYGDGRASERIVAYLERTFA